MQCLMTSAWHDNDCNFHQPELGLTLRSGDFFPRSWILKKERGAVEKKKKAVYEGDTRFL